MERKMLPVGIESFEKLRNGNFYYVDKTGLIRDLLNNRSEVTLFTRPRRFGKSLNMSMLKSFFEIGTDPRLFEGLDIYKEPALCDAYMGKYPVISISLKGVSGQTFQVAYNRLCAVLREEMFRKKFLCKCSAIEQRELLPFNRFLDEQETRADVQSSLKILSNLLYQYYGKKVIVLIDEYDVPLDKAFQYGYYQEMVMLIRNLFGDVLKTNDYLEFAVLTGCLRVAKESIFTGLNNFKVMSITDPRYDEYYGFTDEEVLRLLKDYQLEDHYSEVKAWYDGYRFGNVDVYCPWDVINYVDLLFAAPNAKPKSFWINTSGNEMVKRFVDKADKNTQNEIERLIQGESIEKAIHLELTYDEVDKSIDNLWSVLFTTGYLTYEGENDRNVYMLKIPNNEVREVFILQIQEWFKQTFAKTNESMCNFLRSLENGEAMSVQRYLNFVLTKMISILDTKAPDAQKENFYHGLLLGLLQNDPSWTIYSNTESGDGFSDIIVELDDPDSGLVIEVKYTPNINDLEKASERALQQIKDRRYDTKLREDLRNNIFAYGIAFCKKRCKVICKKL